MGLLLVFKKNTTFNRSLKKILISTRSTRGDFEKTKYQYFHKNLLFEKDFIAELFFLGSFVVSRNAEPPVYSQIIIIKLLFLFSLCSRPHNSKTTFIIQRQKEVESARGRRISNPTPSFEPLIKYAQYVLYIFLKS